MKIKTYEGQCCGLYYPDIEACPYCLECGTRIENAPGKLICNKPPKRGHKEARIR
jgi:hypothetical protein